jgi:PAS domain S-box-containing protein
MNNTDFNVSNANILVVDDNPENLRLLIKILNGIGYKVRPATNGQRALDAIDKEPPDLIVLDIMMPNMNGYEVCEHLKANVQTRHIPVIFISVLGESFDKVKAFSVGGIDYITKPFQEPEVQARVKIHLNLLELQKRLQQQNHQLQLEVAERKQVEEALRKSEKNYKTIFNSANDAILILDIETGDILDANEKMCQMYGYTREKAKQLNVETLSAGVSPYTQKDAMAWIQKALQEPQRFEWSAKNSMGQPFWVEVSLKAIVLNSRPRLLAMVHNISKRKQAEKNLQEAKKAAEQANQAKTNFLTQMSHELRTPLNAILGYTQIFQRDRRMAKWHPQIETIKTSGEHLLMVIDELLDLSKIEAGKTELEMKTFHLPRFLLNLVNIVQVKAQSKEINFDYQASPDLPIMVQGDEKRLRQILLNLLINAIKFTQQGYVLFKIDLKEQNINSPSEKPTLKKGKVLKQGKSSIETQTIVFQVEDSGIGIPSEQLEQIFLPFHQVNSHQMTQGTGLGLTISQKFVRLMDSELHVNSMVGKGSTFWFELNLPTLSTSAQSLQIEPQTIVGYQGKKHRILIVDDVRTNCQVLRDLLLPLGFEIAEANDGQEALKKATEWQPDLMLLDLVIPKIDGFKVVQQIRQKPLLKNMIIIAVSAMVLKNTLSQILAAGCDDCIAKPVSVDRLLQSLQTHFNLEWIYEQKVNTHSQLTSTDTLPLIIPPPDELVMLSELAEMGNITQIKKYLSQIKARNPQLLPFVLKTEPFLKTYQFEQLVDFIESYKENRVNHQK